MKTMLSFSMALTVAAINVNAQNLVPNPGFETNTLHRSLEEINTTNVSGWRQGAGSTADIFTTKIKSAASGYVPPAPRSGNSMAHIISGPANNWVEFITADLIKPTEIGKTYYCEAWVKLVDGCNQASNGLGFFFATADYNRIPGNCRTETPQVRPGVFVSDNKNWTRISGTFIADKVYTSITFGNFFNGQQQFHVIDSLKANSSYRCRYYVDDITVRSGGLTVSGDSVVNIGATATLVAKGGTSYSWVDIRNPKVVLATTAELKIPLSKKTTFRVSSNGDQLEITVDVRKTMPAYTESINGRKVRKGRNVIVHHEEIVIQVHDKNEIDGDSIALYYGDSLVAQHVSLGKRKQSFTIKVDKHTPRQLILYAENLGSVPPNTAALTIKDGRDTTDVVLGSDFKFCDSVLLTYKEE
jgi:hypothetical protein